MNYAIHSFSVLVCFAAIGCGDSSEFGPMTKVDGQVLYKGKPLPQGEVAFYPEKTKGNNVPLPPTGTIASGRYSLKMKEKAGAPLGWYKVVVVSQAPSNPKDPYSVPKSLIPAKYSKLETTPFLVEVKEGASEGTYDLKLD